MKFIKIYEGFEPSNAKLVSLITIDEILKLNGYFLIIGSKMLVITIWQENRKAVINIGGREIEISRKNTNSKSFNLFKKEYGNLYIISKDDLLSKLNIA